MATITFYATDYNATSINNLLGSGIGFYGAGFGYSVEVGSYQDCTFITNSTGTTAGPQINNIKYMNAMSGIINGASSGIALTAMPNALATLNIRFTHSSSVQTQNAKLRIYDRSSINNPASGVTTKVAELIHPGTTQVNTGSGDTTWITPAGSSIVVDFIACPGISGLRPSGASTTAVQHDWYAAISASPDSIGSKSQYAAYFELEYY
jgi:hypothetical protein